MTIDFQAGDPGSSAGQNEATNFQAQGVSSETGNSDDTTVLLELNGRKFTKGELVKKITNADSHINTLTTELSEQRRLLNDVAEQMKKQVNAAELLNQVKNQNSAAPAAVTNSNTAPAPTLSADEVVAAVMGKLQQSNLESTQDTNFNAVKAQLTQAFGNAVNARVKAAADEAGITLEVAAGLARTSPKLFLKMFPELSGKPQASVLPGRGQTNTQSFAAQQPGPSGFVKAKTGKQKVEIYLKKLQDLGI